MNFQKVQSFTFFAFLIGITALFFWMLRPYIYPIFWAAAIAALFYPVYSRILKATKQNKGLASGVTVIIVVLIFLIPLIGLVSLIAQQAVSVYQQFGNEASLEAITSTVEDVQQLPLVQRVAGEVDVEEQIRSAGTALSRFIYQFATQSGQNTIRIVIQFFIMLYALYYFLRDGDRILKKLMHLMPLGDVYEKKLYERFVSTTKATLKGTLLIGTIQGAIGTLAFVITGVPGSLFWGIIMVVLSIIPGVGAAIVLIPTIIVMVLLGNWWQAVVILIAALIAGSIDNVLRGPLVGKDAQMHPLLIFLATLGGLLTFGLSGVVIGPVITAMLLSLWNIYEHKYNTELSKSG